MSKVYITGGCGFIGTNLTLELLKKGHSVTVFDSALTNAEYLEWQGRKPRIVSGDIREKNLIQETSVNCDVMIHLAAWSGVQNSISDPLGAHEVNVTGTANCLEAARINNISKFIFSSSGGTVLGHQEPPVHEEVPVRPVSPYGAHKASGEAYCLGYNGTFGLNTTILRFSNVYGPYIMHKTNLIPNFLRAFRNNEPFYIYGDGEQSRDFIYVKDLVNAIILSIENENSNGEIYQLATNRETTVNQLVSLMNFILDEKFGRKVEVKNSEGLPGEVARNWANISKIKSELGWEPDHNLEEGISEVIDWFTR